MASFVFIREKTLILAIFVPFYVTWLSHWIWKIIEVDFRAWEANPDFMGCYNITAV